MSEENGRTDLTWRELLDEGGARLSEAGVPDAGTDAWYLMEAAFGRIISCWQTMTIS